MPGINNGTLAGLASYALYIILYALGYSPLLDWRYLGIWIPFLFIYLSIKKTKKLINPEPLTFGRSFYTGIVTTFFMSSLKGILIYLTIILSGEGIIDQYFEALQKIVDESKMNGEAILPILQDLPAMRKQFDADMLGVMEFNLHFFGGAIASIILSFFLRAKKKNASLAA
ncbi:MAG: DUF4199 domain-containing protein [Flavobacteriales bacterium]|nr:DUF4199 domain-containing protein [Flavobacteriales bacterium]